MWKPSTALYAILRKFRWQTALTFAIFAGLVRPARASDGVCAQVHLQLQQQMVLTRAAFRATLELSNGTDGDTLENIEVALEIRDLSGQPANALFNTSQLEITGIIGGIEGGGSEPGL